jgi:hypothetical protein|uniref:Uncharacterized protein n=1 Tax=viral metagenome TaxID=1070528 RepID=A0A6C0AH76_9ZZZZ
MKPAFELSLPAHIKAKMIDKAPKLTEMLDQAPMLDPKVKD